MTAILTEFAIWVSAIANPALREPFVSTNLNAPLGVKSMVCVSMVYAAVLRVSLEQIAMKAISSLSTNSERFPSLTPLHATKIAEEMEFVLMSNVSARTDLWEKTVPNEQLLLLHLRPTCWQATWKQALRMLLIS